MRGPLHVIDPDDIEHHNRAYDVDSTATLLVSAHPGRSAAHADADDHGKIILMQYNNLSRM